MEAEDVDSQIVGRDSLAMKRIDAADLAEEMPSCLGMELVLGQGLLAGQEPELALVNFNHEGVLPATDRTIAHGEFWKVRLDLEPNGTAVAAALVFLKRTTCHSEEDLWKG